MIFCSSSSSSFDENDGNGCSKGIEQNVVWILLTSYYLNCKSKFRQLYMHIISNFSSYLDFDLQFWALTERWMNEWIMEWIMNEICMRCTCTSTSVHTHTRFLSFVIFCLSKQSNRVRGRCVCMRFGEYFKRMIKRTISRYNYVYLYV